ncbi:MAG TPA: nuclear transport factor 2 family protein [Gaiellaceae bacterium]|nr:nuclear transport factor 2 family protein [Gaiellaceae bacterium]
MTDPIGDTIEAYRSAVGAKDVEAFVALFAEDVRVFDMWGRFAYAGIAEWRGMAEEWFGSLGDEGVSVEFAEVEGFVSGDTAAASAFLTFRGLSPEGEELRSMTNRLSWVLRRGADGWRVVHEHTSAPLDDEARAIFRR